MFQKLTILTLSTAALLASHGTGRADEKADLKDQLGEYDRAPDYFELSGMSEANRFQRDVAGCTAIVEKLQQLGVPPTEIMSGYMNATWLFRRAPERCARYRSYQLIVQATEILTEAAKVWGILDSDDRTAIAWGERGVEVGKRCVESLDAMLAQGLAKDRIVKIGYDEKVTVGDGQARCAVLVTKAAEMHRVAVAAANERDRIERERYAKHGISGDRFSVLRNHETWVLKGCRESSDLKVLAKAKVVMRFTEGEYATVHQRKITFKGNKKVSDQERTLPNWSHADAACK